MKTWNEEVEKMNQCQPRQDALVEQMKDLHKVANKLGFYDAADYIKEQFIKQDAQKKVDYKNGLRLKK